jgi:DNA-binding transcriptional MerR regulator
MFISVRGAIAKMRIGELAARAGVGIQTIRYYERRGLLREAERRPSGYREYPSTVAQRVRFIKCAQELGFTLEEIADLLALRDGEPRTEGEARDLALAKIGDIDRRIVQLSAMREALATLVEACACSKGAPTCAILEALDDASGAQAARTASASNHPVRRIRP